MELTSDRLRPFTRIWNRNGFRVEKGGDDFPGIHALSLSVTCQVQVEYEQENQQGVKIPGTH